MGLTIRPGIIIGSGITFSTVTFVTNGLVLYLDTGIAASYSGSGSTWFDLTNNNNNGTLNNSPTYSTTNGGILTFNGSTQFVSSTNTSSTNITGSMTCECWFKLNATASDWVRVFGKGDTTNRTYGLWYNTGGSYFLYQRYGSSSINCGVTPLTVNTGVWYQMVGVSNGSSHTLYLNGSSIATASGGSSFYSSSEGYRVAGATFHTLHNGPISIVRLYNTALTATEVLQNFNAERTRFGI